MPDEAKLLFVTSRFPFPPVSGERLRAFQLVRFLSRRYRVTVAALAPPENRAIDQLMEESGCAHVMVARHSAGERLFGAAQALLDGSPLQVGYFRSRGMRKLVAELAPAHDLVIFHLIRRAEEWSLARGIPRVLDMCDALSENYRQTAANGPRLSPWTWVSSLEARRVAAFEREIPEHFDLVSLVSLRDGQSVSIPPSKLRIATNGVSLPDYPFTSPAGRTGRGIALVGKMDFYPNRTGALWFAREVLPSLPQGVFLKVVGDCSRKLGREFQAIPRVQVTGRVSSISAACRDCVAAVAPMEVATGIQNKVLEYFALGLPAVISPSAAGGLMEQATGVCAVARTREEWIAALHVALRGGDDVEGMARAARLYVERHHDWDRIGHSYCKDLDALLLARERSSAVAMGA